jgi:hypothetical protein
MNEETLPSAVGEIEEKSRNWETALVLQKLCANVEWLCTCGISGHGLIDALEEAHLALTIIRDQCIQARVEVWPDTYGPDGELIAPD